MDKHFILAMAFASAFFFNASAQTARPLDIKGLFSLIEENNSSLRVSKSAVEAARHGVEDSKSQLLPDINTQLSASYNGNVLLMNRHFGDVHGLHSPHFGNQLVLDASQTVYSGGALSSGVRLSELGLEKAGIATDLTRQQQRFIVLGEYLDLEKIANREKVVKSNIELTARIISDIKARYGQGVALKNDITRYELQMETLKLHLTKLGNQRSIINNELCTALGIDLTDSIVPTEDVADKIFSRDAEEQWQQNASASSPMLRMSSVDEQVAKQQERLAKSEMLPKVAIVAENNFNGPITFELPPINKNLNVWYVGVGVTYPLSSLYKSNKRLRQAKVEARQAKEQTVVAREQLNNQMHAAWTDYQQSYVELQTQQKSVELARQNFEVINDRYANQLALVTDMIDASNVRLDAELAEVDARINIAYAYYKMKYIAGDL